MYHVAAKFVSLTHGSHVEIHQELLGCVNKNYMFTKQIITNNETLIYEYRCWYKARYHNGSANFTVSCWRVFFILFELFIMYFCCRDKLLFNIIQSQSDATSQQQKTWVVERLFFHQNYNWYKICIQFVTFVKKNVTVLLLL